MLPRMPHPRYAAEGLAQHAGQAGLDDITETKGEGMRYPLPQETKGMRYPLSQETKGDEVPTVSGNKGRRDRQWVPHLHCFLR